MLKNKKVNIVIMAGGSGKRLWPLSRSEKPKQFIKLGSEKTLLEETVDRVKNIFDNQKISVVTSKNYENFVERLVGESIDQIIVEPEAKNTAPAVLYSCLSLQVNPEDIVIFLPSDHHIPDFNKFRESIVQAAQAAGESDNIVLVGIKPNYPATGYGYISVDTKNKSKKINYFDVEKFHEKPNLELAKKYFNSENMLWNSGIICAKLSVLLDAFENQFPGIKNLSITSRPKPARGECSSELFKSEEECIEPCGSRETSKKIYDIIPEISFDYAILEKVNNISVIAGDFVWSDVGTLDLFIAAKKDINNQENLISIESENNLVEVQNKLVVLVGVHDLCVVQTDDVLLISAKKDIDKIKDVIIELNNSGKKEYC